MGPQINILNKIKRKIERLNLFHYLKINIFKYDIHILARSFLKINRRKVLGNKLVVKLLMKIYFC